MVHYFPPTYPDELLYSVLARYHWHVCSGSPKQTLTALFDNRSVRAGVALQTGLGPLSRRLPPELGLTPERLARSFTLYPYLTAFQPPDVQRAVLAAMTEGAADWINVRLGLAASTVRPPAALKYCPTCRSEMLERQGELYWRRAHQLAGVLVCPDHGSPLAESHVVPGLAGQHEFLVADQNNCPVSVAVPSWAGQSDCRRLLAEIAKDSARLLTAPPTSRPLAAWGEQYHAALRERGFGKGRSSIAQGRLLEAFAALFGPIVEILPATLPDGWLAAIGRKHRKAFHPLCHVLLRCVLKDLPLEPVRRPFGTGPWRCRNPLAAHHGQPVIDDLETHSEGGKMIGRFVCSCGYVFSLAEGTGSRLRILDLGPLFEQYLRDLVEAGAGLRRAARTLHVDPGTVRRHAERLGLAVPWKPLARRPPAPRAVAPGMVHEAGLELRPPKPPGRGTKRRDWPALDQEMAERLKAMAAAARAIQPPVRITRAELERRLGKPGWLTCRLEKLPISARTLEQEQEPVQKFQLRRISWAAEELNRQELPVQAWRLRRLAGLPGRVSPDVEDALATQEKKAGRHGPCS